MPRRPAPLLILLGLLLAALPACRNVPLKRFFVRGGADGLVEAGPYADDPRVAALLRNWPELVGRAQDRVALLTGLSLEELEAEAVLTPLGDETRAYEVRTVLRQGRRQPLLRVNLERLATGAERAETVIARGFTWALLEIGLLRTGASFAPWLGALAGTAAAGDLSERLERSVRDDVLAGRDVAGRVDPTDPAKAESTGHAALLLLLERGGPDLVRAFLQGAADGEPPEDLLRRLTREPGSPWGVARLLLEERLADVEAWPWRLLIAAETALAESGRAGFLATLPAEMPPEVHEELAVLGARAALGAGDVDAARALLRVLPEDAAARLRDPRAAAVLALRVEAAPGGDHEAALRLAEQLERDYPRSSDVDRLREELRLPDTPERALAALRRRAAGAGLEELDQAGCVRLVDLLVRGQRYGAAQRVLDRLGERAAAPELAALAEVVAREQREPSAEALEAARETLAAWWPWRDEPTRRDDLVDHGTAGARALLEGLADGTRGPRARVVALVGRCVGAEAVGLLAAAWEAEPRLMAGDLEALAGAVRVTELEVWTRTRAPAALARHDAAALFAALRLDLPEPWVRANPDVPSALRSPDYATRRAAFERVQAEGEATHAPLLVARLLEDPAPMLRRDAVRAAGEAGFEALVRAALEDPAVSVRRAAALALGRSSDPASLERLLVALQTDESAWVRAAAAAAAEQAAPAQPRVVAALLAALEDPEPAVSKVALEVLREVPPQLTSPPALAALEREVARPQMRGPLLVALFSLLEPSLGVTVRYYPGMPPDEVRRVVARARERLGAGREAGR